MPGNPTRVAFLILLNCRTWLYYDFQDQFPLSFNFTIYHYIYTHEVFHVMFYVTVTRLE